MGTALPLSIRASSGRPLKRKLGGASRDRTGDLLHAMQALSQLSYSPKPKRRHFPRGGPPCQGNIPVIAGTYTVSGADPASGLLADELQGAVETRQALFAPEERQSGVYGGRDTAPGDRHPQRLRQFAELKA